MTKQAKAQAQKTSAKATPKKPAPVSIETIKTQLSQAITQANASYVARTKPEKLNIGEDGLNPNIREALALIQSITDAQYKVLRDDFEMDFDLIAKNFSTTGDIKNPLRAPLFMAFMASGDAGYLRASAKTALLAFASAICGAKTRAGIMFSLTGKAHGKASDPAIDNPGYEQASKLVDMLNDGRMNKLQPSTALRQIEVAMGDTGIFPTLGMAKPMARNGIAGEFIPCPATLALQAMIASASNGLIEQWAQ